MAIKDVPIFENKSDEYLREVLPCIDKAGPRGAKAACGRERSAVLVDEGLSGAVVLDANAVLVDTTDLYCGPENCSPVVGHVVVYRDGYHITDSYAETVAPYLGERIAAALANV